MSGHEPLTTKWLLGILVSILVLGGAGWMTSMSAGQRDLEKRQTQTEIVAEKNNVKLDTIDKRTDRIEKQLDEINRNTELLLRTLEKERRTRDGR